MSATITHKPWCTDHAVDPAEQGDQGFCSHTVELGGPDGPSVELAKEGDRTVILLWPGFDRRVTAQVAREVAAALVEAAATVESDA